MRSNLASYVNAKESSRQSEAKQKVAQPSPKRPVNVGSLYANVPKLSTAKPSISVNTKANGSNGAQNQRTFLLDTPRDAFDASDLDDTTTSISEYHDDGRIAYNRHSIGHSETRFAHGGATEQDDTVQIPTPPRADADDASQDEYGSDFEQNYPNVDENLALELRNLRRANNSYPPTSSGFVPEEEESPREFLEDATMEGRNRQQHRFSLPLQQVDFRLSHQQELNNDWQRAEQRRSLTTQEANSTNKRKVQQLSSHMDAVAQHQRAMDASLQGGLALAAKEATTNTRNALTAQLPTRLSAPSSSASSTRPEAKGHSNNLDHDYQDLVRMDFADLCSEPFDKNPRYAPTLLGQDMATKPLAERLEHVFRMSPAEQQTFFSGVSMEEWQEAGTWFNEKFARLTAKLAESRQARRKIALRFEEQVVKRHEAIREERQDLDNALKRLRDNGDVVLKEGTPSRRKTRG